MSTGINHLITILVAVSSVFGVAAVSQANPAELAQNFPKADLVAQTQSNKSELPKTESIPDLINRAFFHHTGASLNSGTIWKQINTIFGLTAFPEGSYPENQIRWETRLIDTLYQDLLEQQVNSDPTVRTNDLKSPYCSSVMTDPKAICF